MAVTAVAATVAQRFLLHHAAVAAVAANQALEKIVVCFLARDDFQFKGVQNH
jgi:hypothetical protein